jgi:hypothetical protein
MKSKRENAEADKSSRSPMEVEIKFTLPAFRAEFEAMDGQKWKQLVADLLATVQRWQLTDKNEELRCADQGVCLQLRDYMAGAGLTLANAEFVEAERQKRLTRYAEAFSKKSNEANQEWGLRHEIEQAGWRAGDPALLFEKDKTNGRRRAA